MNKQEAADFLNVSTRAVERYTAKGKLTPAYEKGRTGLAPVYSKAQLEELKAEMEAAPVRPDKRDTSDKGDGNEKTTALALTRRRESSPALAELVAAIEQARMQAKPFAPLEAKLTLSLSEASALSGLSRGYLRQAIEDKKLKARIIGRGWRVKRDDLDAYVKKL
jgi:excisionase family DNA binding protein